MKRFAILLLLLTYNAYAGVYTRYPATGTTIGAVVTSGTSGSVLFVDSSGNLAQDNAKFFWDDTNFRLGIGTSAPAFSIDNQTTFTGTSGNQFATNFAAHANQSGASTGIVRGTQASADTKSGNGFNLNLIGGGFMFATHADTSTVTTALGVQANASNTSTGTVTTATGSVSRIFNSGGGTIGNAQTITAKTPSNTSGTITNTYGLFVESQANGTQTNTPYGVYSAGSADYSYFAGLVGIGTTIPLNKLDVSGATAIGTYAGVNTAPSNGLIVSGNVGVGTNNPATLLSVASGSKFQVDTNGNVLKINNVATSFPASQGAANSLLKNDSAGNLTWNAPSRQTNTCNSAVTCAVTCSSGLAVGGGCQAASLTLLDDSYPSSTTAWTCNYAASVNITAYVICI